MVIIETFKYSAQFVKEFVNRGILMKITIALLLAIIMLGHVVFAETCETYDTLTDQVLPDNDCDIFPNNDDNCPNTYNPEQQDSDNDGIGDACEQKIVGQPETYDATVIDDTASLLQLKYVSLNELQRGGQGEIYTIRITNPSSYAIPVSLELEPILEWGTYSITPAKNQKIQPGESISFNIWVKADFSASPGEKHFKAFINSGQAVKELDLYADIIAGSQTKKSTNWEETVLIVVIVLLFAAGLAVGFDKFRKEK